MTGNQNPLQHQALKWKAAKLREFEENEHLLERIAKQENDMKRQFEDSAQIMLQEQAKRERAAYIEELQRVQKESKLQNKNIAQEAILAKNRNDKLNREVLDKEQLVLDLQNRVTLQESDAKYLKEQLALSETKVRALEAFSSDV